MTPLFDTTLKKRVRIDYCVKKRELGGKASYAVRLQAPSFPQAILLSLQKQVPDSAKETYGQFVQKIVRKSKIDPAAISFPILPSDKPFL